MMAESSSSAPAEADAYTNRDPTSTFNVPQSLASLSLSGSRTGSTTPLSPTMNLPQIYNITRSWAAGYANSFPGADNLSKNTAFHTYVRYLLSGRDKYEDRIDDLIDLGTALRYRLDGMAQATYYKDVLGLDYLDCDAFEVEAWTYPLYVSDQLEAKEKIRRYNNIYDLIHDSKLFSRPVGSQGWYYSKPGHYLAIALVESRKSKEEVVEAINILKAVRATDLASKIDEVRRGN